MAESFLCTVATPDFNLFTGPVYYAGVPGADGSFGVLRNHQLMVAKNGEGVLKLNMDEQGSDTRTFLIYHGVSQVFNNMLTVCGRFGIEISKIDPEITKERLQTFQDEIDEIEKLPDSDVKTSRMESAHDHHAWYELQQRYLNGEVH